MNRLPTGVRKEQIKEAVLGIIYQDGIHQFTTKRLAREIGISEAAIFRHFASKLDIFLEILTDVDNQLLSSMKEIEKADAPAAERLHRIVCATIHFFMKNKGLSVLMLSEISVNNHPEIKSRVCSIYSEQRKIVERIAHEGVGKGEVKAGTDPRSFSLLYLGIPLGIQIDLLLNKNDFSEDRFCERVSRTFLQNFLISGENLRQPSNHL